MIPVRIVIGAVFITEGTLQFILADELGAGRFAHIGLPMPHLLAPLAGSIEIVAGVALAPGFYSGEAAILLLAVLSMAIVSTRIPILLGHSIGGICGPGPG